MKTLELLTVALFACLVIPTAQAQKVYPLPKVVSRADWGARAPLETISRWSDYGLSKPVYTDVVLHQTAMGAGVGVEEVQRIQSFQMDQNHFADIAYNFLIDANGTIYEGRLLSLVPGHAGQTQEANREHDIRKDPDYAAIGISFSASSSDWLTQAQVDAAKSLIQFWKTRKGYNIRSVYTHAEVKQRLIDRGLTPIGEYDAHVCPGTGTVEDIVRLRNELKAEFGIPFDEKIYRKLFE